MLRFYLSDGTLLTSLSFTSLEAGRNSDVLAFEIWNDRDAPGGNDRENIFVVMETENPTIARQWLRKGIPAQDETWGRYRIVGFDNRGDSTWSMASTDWQLLGGDRAIEIPRIPSDSGVRLEFKLHPPSTAVASSIRLRLVPLHSEYALPLPVRSTGDQAGVVLHHDDPTKSYAIRGLSLSTSGSDTVTIDRGTWLYQGKVNGTRRRGIVFDQLDENGGALAIGESYYAAISLGSEVTVTKGIKGDPATLPAVPIGEVFLRYVEIRHDAASTTIEDTDLSGAPVFGRYHAERGNGLELHVFAGEIHYGETRRIRMRRVSLLLQDNTTETVWVLSNGQFQLAPIRPEAFVFPLYEITTTLGAVTTLTDLRTFAGVERQVELRDISVLTGPADLLTFRYFGPPIVVEKAWFSLSDNGMSQGATAGQTAIDVLIDGVSVFDVDPEDDPRPSFPWDTTDLYQESLIQRPYLPSGKEITVQVVTTPTGGEPLTLSVTLIGYEVLP